MKSLTWRPEGLLADWLEGEWVFVAVTTCLGSEYGLVLTGAVEVGFSFGNGILGAAGLTAERYASGFALV
jgi:hypothetical protein